ncbi:ABC transporter substrate-binding protein [Crystallibacter crystallopoietes]|uniref:ABC transporter substrate-binding protein n=1 Tax=Crystallibacter crystallopoietes TaxID=37928 RepID=UPI0003076885|nr:ABC transporter substrate-binding protein [Arthrobacter crystallopoietes]
MKAFRKFSALFAAAGVTAIALSGCSAQASAENSLGTISPGELRVGTLTDAKPYAYIEGGEQKGFDVDMLREVAKRLDLDVEFVNQEFSALLPSVANGQLDVATASISNTEERRKVVDFSDTYFIGYISVLANPESGIGEDPKSLAGKRLGIVQGTIQDAYAQKNFTGAELVRFPDNNAAVSAMKSGTIDAHFLDFPVAEDYAAANEGMTVAINVPVPEFPVGFAVNKNDSELKEAINQELKEIIADGTWLEIEKGYFPDQPVDEMFMPAS